MGLLTDLGTFRHLARQLVELLPGILHHLQRTRDCSGVRLVYEPSNCISVGLRLDLDGVHGRSENFA